MAASSSSTDRNHEGEKYEVFISFRGSDVRIRFLSHLFAALQRKQIHAFIDDDLERGKEISGNLFRIIEESDLSIVVFSQNYPKSEWCLEELEKIQKSMKEGKQIVVPVFYEVDPSDVQLLRGNYEIEEQKWRDGLVEISNLSGFDSKNSGNEAKLIDDIVLEVSKILSKNWPSISHNHTLFGIDSSINDVESLLCIDWIDDVRMVGIWGMGGIGKTTIATKVFERVKKKFDGHCFVSNVRETLSTMIGLNKLQVKFVRDLLGDKDVREDSSHPIDHSIRRRLKRIKVLIVLDDVDTCMQLKSLLETSGLYSPDSFFPGSRIIVTSRDSQVLKDVKMKSVIYEAKQLKEIHALQLFSWHAFGPSDAQQEYRKLSEKVVKYCHGVPLALVVLGSELRHKTTTYWEEALKKFNTISPLEIQKILRISFDGLDRDQKNIFLDIACFFKGRWRADVERMLDASGFYASIGIDRLVDKSLLKEERGKITMHDLLEQMGKEIVEQEKENQQQQSRLWEVEDIRDVLTSNRGTRDVEAILLLYWDYDEIDINTKAFIPMCKLRRLLLQGPLQCPMGIEYLPDSIMYLEWIHYPLDYWPSNYDPEKLVDLTLIESQLKELVWNKPLKNLKFLNLSLNGHLIRVSDLAMAPNLVVIRLRWCESLVEIGSSLKNLKKLTELDVRGCTSLTHLPEIPCSIVELNLGGSGLRQLPSTIGRLTHLKELSLLSCQRLESLPSSICNLISVKRVDLAGCRKLKKLPEDFGNLGSLEELDASRSGLRDLPSSICNLISVKRVNFARCWKIKKLPEDFGNLESLEELDASCSGLRDLPSSICNLISVKRVNLARCWKIKKLPEDFGNLESLEELDASGSGLEELPLSIRNLKKLVRLNLHCCRYLESLTALPSNLEFLVASKCTSLGILPTPFVFPKHVASSIMEQYLWAAENQPAEMQTRLCIEGSEVPQWMKHCDILGSYICLKMGTGVHPINFIFCIVSPSRVSYNTRAVLTHENGQSEYCFTMGKDRVLYLSDKACHVLLWNRIFHYKYIKAVSFYHDGIIMEGGAHPIFHYKNYSERKHQEDEADPNTDRDFETKRKYQEEDNVVDFDLDLKMGSLSIS